MALKSVQGNWTSSHIEGGILWFFSSCNRKIWAPLELQQGHKGTSHVASEKSGLLSRCQGAPQDFFRVTAVE